MNLNPAIESQGVTPAQTASEIADSCYEASRPKKRDPLMVIPKYWGWVVRGYQDVSSTPEDIHPARTREARQKACLSMSASLAKLKDALEWLSGGKSQDPDFDNTFDKCAMKFCRGHGWCDDIPFSVGQYLRDGRRLTEHEASVPVLHSIHDELTVLLGSIVELDKKSSRLHSMKAKELLTELATVVAVMTLITFLGQNPSEAAHKILTATSDPWELVSALGYRSDTEIGLYYPADDPGADKTHGIIGQVRPPNWPSTTATQP